MVQKDLSKLLADVVQRIWKPGIVQYYRSHDKPDKEYKYAADKKVYRLVQ